MSCWFEDQNPNGFCIAFHTKQTLLMAHKFENERSVVPRDIQYPERRSYSRGKARYITFVCLLLRKIKRLPEPSLLALPAVLGAQHPGSLDSSFVSPARSPGASAWCRGASAQGQGWRPQSAPGPAPATPPLSGRQADLSRDGNQVLPECYAASDSPRSEDSSGKVIALFPLSPPFLAPALPLLAAGSQRWRSAPLLLPFLWLRDSLSY